MIDVKILKGYTEYMIPPEYENMNCQKVTKLKQFVLVWINKNFKGIV